MPDAMRGKPYQERNTQTDSDRCRGMHPENGRPDQQITQCATTHTRHGGKKSEGHHVLPCLGCHQRARNGEHRRTGHVEIGQR